MADRTISERLSVVETRTEALPLMQQQINEIAAWVNQQKGREALGKFVLPLLAVCLSLAAFIRGG